MYQIDIHAVQGDDLEKMKSRVLEKHFLSSSHGEAFRAKYDKLREDRAALEASEREMWEAARPKFVEYLTAMGGRS